MNISEKIEAVRREPESVRLRYVWGCVALSMFLISIIWVFSITSLFKKNNSEIPSNVDALKNQLESIKKQSPSLKELSEQPLKAVNEGVTVNENLDEFKYPATITKSETPQSPAYSTQ